MKNRILVVEDDVSAGSLYTRYLQQHGYEARHVMRGEDALEALAESYYTVMLLDLMMPGARLDGRSVVERYRDISPGTAVIVVTAYNDRLSAVEAVRGRVVDWLEKPVRGTQIVASIEPYVRKLVRFGFELDVRAQSAVVLGRQLSLSPRQFQCLAALVRHGSCSYAELDWYVDGRRRSEDEAESTFNTHISRLRRRIRHLTGRDGLVWSKDQKRHILVDMS